MSKAIWVLEVDALLGAAEKIKNPYRYQTTANCFHTRVGSSGLPCSTSTFKLNSSFDRSRTSSVQVPSTTAATWPRCEYSALVCTLFDAESMSMAIQVTGAHASLHTPNYTVVLKVVNRRHIAFSIDDVFQIISCTLNVLTSHEHCVPAPT